MASNVHNSNVSVTVANAAHLHMGDFLFKRNNPAHMEASVKAGQVTRDVAATRKLMAYRHHLIVNLEMLNSILKTDRPLINRFRNADDQTWPATYGTLYTFIGICAAEPASVTSGDRGIVLITYNHSGVMETKPTWRLATGLPMHVGATLGIVVRRHNVPKDQRVLAMQDAPRHVRPLFTLEPFMSQQSTRDQLEAHNNDAEQGREGVYWITIGTCRRFGGKMGGMSEEALVGGGVMTQTTLSMHHSRFPQGFQMPYTADYVSKLG